MLMTMRMGVFRPVFVGMLMFVIVRVGMVVVVAVFMIAFHFGFSLVVTLNTVPLVDPKQERGPCWPFELRPKKY